jgi:hypothetical protein
VRAGWIASGVGHVGLIVFLLFAGFFSSAPLPPMEVAEVTVISEEEFALLTRPEIAPEAGAGITAPDAPSVPSEAPPPPARPDVAESPAKPEAPEPAIPAELTAPPPVDVAVPELPPSPEAAPRVAQEAQPEPEPDTVEAPEVVERVSPEAAEEAEVLAEEETPEAPPEAAPEIVTEAETPSGAPDTVPRPRARPDRVARIDPGRSFAASSAPEPEPDPPPEPTEPQPQVAETPTEAPAGEADPLAAAIAGAVADAISNTPEAAPEAGAPSGPPLSQGERDAFRVSVERCWIVDPGSPAASVTVIVGMRMTRDAKPDTASISLLGSQGGDDSAVRTAYEAARRAILRCGTDGFPLPPEKYQQWAQVEMTFNPEGMRVR